MATDMATSRRIGLAPLTVLELAPADMVSCAADAGYDFVGLRLIAATPEEPQHDVVGNESQVREIERRLAATGVQVLDIEIFRLKPDTRVADYRAALEAGARLGARHALVAGQDPEPARLAENFAAFCELADGFKLTADIEPMPWVTLRTLADADAVIRAAGNHRNAGIVIDPIHFDRAGDHAGSIADLPLSHWHYLQLCDAPAQRPPDMETLLHQARAERLMPGDGGLDLRALVLALPETLPITLEVPMRTLAQTVPAVERARRLLARTRALLESIEARRPSR